MKMLKIRKEILKKLWDNEANNMEIMLSQIKTK